MKMRYHAFALLFFIQSASTLQSQDMAIAEPRSTEVLDSIDSTRVLEVRMEPGQAIGTHSHPPRVIYCITEIAIKSVSQNGDSTFTFGQPGEIIWVDKSTTHSETNVGESEAVFLITELSGTAEPGKEEVKKTKDEVIDRFHTLAVRAYQHRIKPVSLGGGFTGERESFEGFEISPRMMASVNAMYKSQVLDRDHISFTAISPLKLGIIHAVVNARGELVSWYFDQIFR